MSRDIGKALCLVMPPAYHTASSHHHGTNRYLALGKSGARLGKSQPHIIIVVKQRIHIRVISMPSSAAITSPPNTSDASPTRTEVSWTVCE